MELLPEWILASLIGGGILKLAGSINWEKNDFVGTGIKNKDSNASTPGMKIIDEGKEWNRNGKSYSSMGFLLGAAEIVMDFGVFKNIWVGAFGFL